MEQTDAAAGPRLASRRVLEVVRNLHAMGYERLRICPRMSPSGLSWRCTVTPVTNVGRTHGAWIATWNDNDPMYGSGMGDRLFGWDDAPGKSVAQLGRLFLERFPETAEAGWGADRAYARWYREMLERTEPDRLPYAYADWPMPPDGLPTIGPLGAPDLVLPLPPGGERDGGDPAG